MPSASPRLVSPCDAEAVPGIRSSRSSRSSIRSVVLFAFVPSAARSRPGGGSYRDTSSGSSSYARFASITTASVSPPLRRASSTLPVVAYARSASSAAAPLDVVTRPGSRGAVLSGRRRCASTRRRLPAGGAVMCSSPTRWPWSGSSSPGRSDRRDVAALVFLIVCPLRSFDAFVPPRRFRLLHRSPVDRQRPERLARAFGNPAFPTGSFPRHRTALCALDDRILVSSRRSQ